MARIFITRAKENAFSNHKLLILRILEKMKLSIKKNGDLATVATNTHSKLDLILHKSIILCVFVQAFINNNLKTHLQTCVKKDKIGVSHV